MKKFKKYNIRENFNFFDDFGDGFMDIAKGIKDAIWAIGDALKGMYCGAVFLAKLLIWTYKTFVFITFIIINPVALINDFTGTLIKLTRLFFYSLIEIILSVMKYFINNFIGPSIGSFWGWDQAEGRDVENDVFTFDQFQDTPSEDQSGGDESNKKCFEQDNNKLPISILIATIILPPLGLMMEFGLSYWINILLCCCLTLFYYFPGLIYALALLYS